VRIESQLQIVYWPVSKLRRYIENPRNNHGAVDRICASQLFPPLRFSTQGISTAPLAAARSCPSESRTTTRIR
jgi:hypothetical protein